MKPPRNLKKYLDGKIPLPAGFVPLAYSPMGSLFGMTPKGWAAWIPHEKHLEPKDHLPFRTVQKPVMGEVIATLGGTSAKAAKAIGVSPRTVESWRCGRKRLTVERAYEIARAMADD